LREFRNNLLKHFDFEEDSGFFRRFPRSNSNARAFEKKIKIEHRQIIRELDKIMVRLKKVEDITDANLKSIECDIINLVLEIYRHEQTEVNLIQSINQE
jgi:hypothetical protein